jgi:hypothetical protein
MQENKTQENIDHPIEQEQVEMEYLQATSDLTPWMIHLRLNGDGRYIYRMSGLLPEEDPTVYFDLDTFTLPPEESEPIRLTEDSVPVQDIAIRNRQTGKSDISFYFWEKIAYSIHFPLKWAIQETYGKAIGPKVCAICEKYGFQDGIFLGYCADCAEKCRNS